MSNIRIGDTIVVTNPVMTFGDYGKGSVGVVEAVESGGVHVRWIHRRFVDKDREEGRCCYLHYREIELKERA